ncbi:MAG TPA: hypothetical protein DD379_15145 [Cyanobacteria bacterium UBA11162]|nr:hypothetical protein [Cyanobacteria bacterium UBA11162]
MSKAYLSKTILSQATPILGAAALSAIALLGMPQSASANGDCSLEKDGADWVSTCESGVDSFPKSWAIISFWLLNPDGSMGQTFDHVMLSGPATVLREDGDDGIIKTTLNHRLTGNIPGLGDITLIGNGSGEIQDQDGDGLASSFFDVFATIDTPFGVLGNKSDDPIRVDGDRWLTGVSPDVVIPPFPPVPPLPVPPPNIFGCNDPNAAIAYCGDDPILLFAVDPDGNLGTTPVAILHNEVHIVHPRVPEPSTALASIFAGLTMMFGLTKKQRSKKS